MLRCRTSRIPILAILAVAACSGPAEPGADPTPSAAAGLGNRPARATPSAVVTREISTTYDFLTPSKNIGCLMTSNSARCDIVTKSWKPPAKPADCDLDWGNGVAVVAANKGEVVCAGDTVRGTKTILPYGEAVKVDNFVCESASSGVRCANTASGHGFTLSRQSYTVF